MNRKNRDIFLVTWVVIGFLFFFVSFGNVMGSEREKKKKKEERKIYVLSFLS